MRFAEDNSSDLRPGTGHWLAMNRCVTLIDPSHRDQWKSQSFGGRRRTASSAPSWLLQRAEAQLEMRWSHAWTAVTWRCLCHRVELSAMAVSQEATKTNSETWKNTQKWGKIRKLRANWMQFWRRLEFLTSDQGVQRMRPERLHGSTVSRRTSSEHETPRRRRGVESNSSLSSKYLGFFFNRKEWTFWTFDFFGLHLFDTSRTISTFWHMGHDLDRSESWDEKGHDRCEELVFADRGLKMHEGLRLCMQSFTKSIVNQMSNVSWYHQDLLDCVPQVWAQRTGIVWHRKRWVKMPHRPISSPSNQDEESKSWKNFAQSESDRKRVTLVVSIWWPRMTTVTCSFRKKKNRLALIYSGKVCAMCLNWLNVEQDEQDKDFEYSVWVNMSGCLHYNSGPFAACLATGPLGQGGNLLWCSRVVTSHGFIDISTWNGHWIYWVKSWVSNWNFDTFDEWRKLRPQLATSRTKVADDFRRLWL